MCRGSDGYQRRLPGQDVLGFLTTVSQKPWALQTPALAQAGGGQISPRASLQTPANTSGPHSGTWAAAGHASLPLPREAPPAPVLTAGGEASCPARGRPTLHGDTHSPTRLLLGPSEDEGFRKASVGCSGSPGGSAPPTSSPSRVWAQALGLHQRPAARQSSPHLTQAKDSGKGAQITQSGPRKGPSPPPGLSSSGDLVHHLVSIPHVQGLAPDLAKHSPSGTSLLSILSLMVQWAMAWTPTRATSPPSPLRPTQASREPPSRHS